jgi:hypothetical protein
VGGGKITASPDALQSALDSRISETESSMSQSWIERSLVPLRKSVPDFEVQRLRALHLAASIERIGTSIKHKVDFKPRMGCEIWVQSEDGTVGGFVDAAYEQDGKPVIRDYKTGLILEANSADDPKPNVEYLIQVKLYAALYCETFGEWPSFAELVPLQGEAIRIEVDPEECMGILQNAKDTLHTVNALVLRTASRLIESIGALAAPSSGNCRRCLSRPACRPYYNECVKEDREWPADVWGVLEFRQLLGNGRSLLRVIEGNQIIVVRQITTSTERHPALESLEPGNKVGIYNVRFNANHTEATETDMTTIYRLS